MISDASVPPCQSGGRALLQRKPTAAGQLRPTATDQAKDMDTSSISRRTLFVGIDSRRVYGTGQSMGCMTVMLLAARHNDLFAAELLVSGQWDITQLTGLPKEKFIYTAAGGDLNASGGQTAVKKMLKAVGVPFQTATWNATWTAEQLATAAAKLLAAGDNINFATFKAGTVLTASGASADSNGGAGEHMASFKPAYEMTALRDWLFRQTA